MAKEAKTLKQAAPVRRAAPKRQRPAFECIALLLQGGGALGAYQGGAYQALAEADIHPDWVAGISIGAINSAIIAGNAPEHRVERLRSFWEDVTSNPSWTWTGDVAERLAKGDQARRFFNQASAGLALLHGVPGFFTPRFPPPWLRPDGCLEATSWYDTGPLRATLERVVDFDRLNAGETRVSFGAVNVRSGNFCYFDSQTEKIGLEHVLASGGLPPGFPAVEIEGEYYWDGGLVSNTPLHWVLQCGPRQDTLAFQIDLWNARGNFPRNVFEVATRQKEITYSSRTREQSDRFRHMQSIRHAVATLMQELPDELKRLPQAKLLQEFGDQKVYNLVHLIYRYRNYESDSKDYEFSRLSMEEHWRAGYLDTKRALRHREVLERPTCPDGVLTFDFAAEDRG